jgi:sodium/bile acid cotransporter 7
VAPQWATVTVFLLTGLSLRLADVRAALNAKRAALYGLVSCLGLSALLAPAILAHGPEALPMLHHEFFAGLALLCCVPTTLSTGVILARQANANDALVLLLMLLTNVIGVATLPFALAHIFGAAVGAAIEPLVMLQGLALTVLAPLLAGVVAQTMIPGVSKLVDKARAYMRLAQQACLIATPWMTISESQHQLVHIDAETLAIVAGAAFALHLTLLFGNAAASAILGLGGRGRGSRRTRRALLLAASQKTLPVSVVALSQLGNTLGEPGLVLLPCIFFHLIQIVFGSMLVAVWRSVDEERL